jgi:hypothetical protein
MTATRRFLPVASAQTVDFFTCYLISKHRDWKEWFSEHPALVEQPYIVGLESASSAGGIGFGAGVSALDVERRWLLLANSYTLSERITAFTGANPGEVKRRKRPI